MLFFSLELCFISAYPKKEVSYQLNIKEVFYQLNIKEVSSQLNMFPSIGFEEQI